MVSSAALAQSPDPELIPHSGVTFKRGRLGDLPPFVPREQGRRGVEILKRKDILAELRMVTGVDFHERGQNPMPPPLPRITCRFESYSVVNHDWMEEFMAWFKEERHEIGLTYRQESWDCDDYSQLANAMADLALMKSDTKGPPQLIGRLIVHQVYEWGGTKPAAAHEIIIFRSGQAWWVAEPQSGVMASLWEYPNRQYIREILFN